MCLNCPQMAKSMTKEVEDLGWDKEMEVVGLEMAVEMMQSVRT